MNPFDPPRPAWTDLIPAVRGVLPGGAPLCRTDPSGDPAARVVFLGVYPAATRVRVQSVGGVRLSLPMAVEAESFDPRSASGAEIDDNYLAPLGLSRADVLITDLVPYFLANTTPSKSGRSMADNIRLYEQATGRNTGVQARPSPEDLIRLAREMPGNVERLREILGRCSPALVLTLGLEPAAVLRGQTYAWAKVRTDDLLYGTPARLDVFGVTAEVVHLVHPHLFLKRDAKWMGRHAAWCEVVGRGVVARACA